MEILCIFDVCFENLLGFLFEFYYVDVINLDGGDYLWMYYVDEGLCDGKVVLLLYGELIWGYFYWKMILGFVDVGCCVIVLD